MGLQKLRMLNNENEKTTFNALRPFEKIKITRVCPSCSSVFVTKKECESCGLQFWVDLLGEPFGERSFFVLKEDFELNCPFYLKWLPSGFFASHDTVKKYRRMLLKRFEVLLGYFFDEVEEDISRRKVFLFEADELVKEFLRVHGEASALWKMIERGEKHPLTQHLFRSLEFGGDSLAGSGLSRLYWRQFNQGLLKEFLFTVAAVTVAAYLVFKYLNT